MNYRYPLALPFASLALIAGCSSSSTTDVVTEKDSGVDGHTVTTTNDAGKDSNTTTDGGPTNHDGSPAPDTGTVATGPVPAAGSISLVSGIFTVVGITDDDYLVYYDSSKGGVYATSTTAGTTETIAAGSTVDGGIQPTVVNLGGTIVGILSDYTSTTAGYPLVGTLSIWSHTATGGHLVQVATNSTGILGIASDSSYFAYTDNSNAAGTAGNIGFAPGSGVGGVDVITGVNIDTTFTVSTTTGAATYNNTTCYPLVAFSGTYAVATTCAGTSTTPSISSYNSASSPAWGATLLTATAGASNAGNATANFALDTNGTNVLTANGANLYVQGIASTTPTPVTTSLAAPAKASGAVADGSELFFLNDTSTAAYFTQANGALGKATLAAGTAPNTNPTFAPAGSLVAVTVLSPDTNYDMEYNSALDPSGSPTSLNLRNLTSGTSTVLQNAGTGLATDFGAGASFTTDLSYGIFSTDLSVLASMVGTAGTLKTVNVSTGAINEIVTNPIVWDAVPGPATTLVYNENYTENALLQSLYASPPSGLAYADIYVADAKTAGAGTLLVSGADAPDDTIYLTKDRSTLFYSFSKLVTADGGLEIYSQDGIYSVKVPTP